MKKVNLGTFTSAIFFVLGFSLVFSVLGILLQTVLSNVSYAVQLWLSRLGGVIIIFFGLYLLGLIRPKFLEAEHKVTVRRKFRSQYLTSFVFGAAFAVGWTPCVTAALGAILALAATSAGSAFVLLVSYTLGLGIPFLIVGLFTSQAQRLINRAGKWLEYLQMVFGAILIFIGILIFTEQLSRIANWQSAANLLSWINAGTTAGASIKGVSLVNLGVAFSAGLVSFLSPCVLPLIPGFLSYLASTAVVEKNETKD